MYVQVGGCSFRQPSFIHSFIVGTRFGLVEQHTHRAPLHDIHISRVRARASKRLTVLVALVTFARLARSPRISTRKVVACTTAVAAVVATLVVVARRTI